MLDTNMLTAMRDAISLLLPDVCDILTLTQTSNGQGGISETWAVSYSEVSCRLDVKSSAIATGFNSMVGGAVQQFTGYMLSVPYDTTINAEDRVEIDDVIYAVTGINAGQSWMAVKRVSLEAV